jgi:hypothetical protein
MALERESQLNFKDELGETKESAQRPKQAPLFRLHSIRLLVSPFI